MRSFTPESLEGAMNWVRAAAEAAEAAAAWEAVWMAERTGRFFAAGRAGARRPGVERGALLPSSGRRNGRPHAAGTVPV